jgi:hypothetical protein
MASAEIEEQERASSSALNGVISHFAREVARHALASDVANVEEMISHAQAFQSVLDTFEADALRYQQAGLPRIAGELVRPRKALKRPIAIS